MTDMVNHPPHYTHGPIECIRAIHAALGNRGFLAYLRGTIIKYSWRAEHKGATMQDMAKIGFYSNEAVEVAGAIQVEESNTKATDMRAMQEALEHAALQARKDAETIDRLENELIRAQRRPATHAPAAQVIAHARQAMKEADFAAKGIVFAVDGNAASDIVAIQNHAQGLISRIGRA
jgi:hypothetical protein